MKNNINLSIVVPIKDCESSLRHFLKSFPDGTNLELLLIYFQSKDKTLEVAKFYSSNNKNISLKECFEKGIYTAMNLGIDICTGQYLLFIGADDVIDFEKLEEMSENFLSKKIFDILITPLNILHKNHVKKLMPKLDGKPYMFHHQSLFFNGKFLRDNLIKYDLIYKIHSDFDFIQRCFNIKCKYKILNIDPLVSFNLDGKSTSKRFTFQSSKELINIFLKYDALFTKKFLMTMIRKIYYLVKI